jgi:hypothetical protein
MVRGLRPGEKALLNPVFRGSLPAESTIAVTDGLGFGDDPWTDWNHDPQYPSFYYKMHVGDYADRTLSNTDYTPYGRLCDLFIHELAHVWQYHHGRQVKLSSLYAHTIGSYKFKAGDPWIDYNVEQQASIVEGWHKADMKKDHELFPYICGVIWTGGNDRVINLSYAELKSEFADFHNPPPHVNPGQIPMGSIDAVLIPILATRFHKDDVAGYTARVKQLETLFRGLDQLRAAALLLRLSVRRNGDQASMYFHDILSPATREKLLKILRGFQILT